MSRVLVVDDEPRIVSFVSRALSAAGLPCDHALDGRSALRLASTGIYDLVLLDLNLPDLDGADVLASLSECADVSVVVLSARAGSDERVRCLRLGATDFVPKPFAIAELVARVQVRLRERRTGQSTRHEKRVGRLTLDVRARTAEMGAGTVHLSEREFGVLDYLVDRVGTIVAREELLADVWGYWFDPGSNLVEVIVRRLRLKLGADLIETIRHVGYRLVPR